MNASLHDAAGLSDSAGRLLVEFGAKFFIKSTKLDILIKHTETEDSWNEETSGWRDARPEWCLPARTVLYGSLLELSVCTKFRTPRVGCRLYYILSLSIV